jgi:HK97 family phage major capsid protein
MKFKTVAEAFNYYRNKDVKELEARAAAINADIDSNPNADIEAYNIELRGIKEAKENIELRSQNGSQAAGLNLVTGRNLNGENNAPKTFTGDVAATPEYRSAFFKTLLGQKLTENEKAAYAVAQANVEKRADVFNAASDSVAVLPTSTLNEVVKKARTMGGLLAECRSFAMPTKIAIPVGTPASKAEWHTEGAEVAGEKVVTTSVVFDGYEIIKVFSISAKTRTMSIAAFENYITDELTACVMETIADALINGTGSDQGTGLEKGITWTDGTNQVTAAAADAFTYKEIVSTVAMLKRGYAQGAKWAMNNATLYNYFYGLVDSNKRPIFIADPQGESVGKVLGFDIVIDDNIPDGEAYLGNYKQYLGYNMPEGIAVEVSRESSFKKGLVDYRALAIADCKPIVADAFVRIIKKAAA